MLLYGIGIRKDRCFNDRPGKTPYEALTGLKPNLSNMHVFGMLAYAYVQNAKKLEPRSKGHVTRCNFSFNLQCNSTLERFN
jgi:hypothetical protein